MSLFSLIALFTGTLTWFMSVRSLQNATDNFDIDNISLMVKSISIHNQINSNSNYIFNSSPAVKYDVVEDRVEFADGYSEANLDDITIRSYSSLSETPDSTLLYLFEINKSNVNSENDNFSIKIKTDTPDSAESGAMDTEGSLVYKDSNGLAHKLVYDVTPEEKTAIQTEFPDITDEYFGNNSMSSTITFDIKGYTSLSTTTINNTSTYDLHNDFVNSNVYSDENNPSKVYSNEQVGTQYFGRSSFVTITGSNTSTGDVTYNYSNTIDAFTRESGTEQECPQYVAIVCHYNADALQYIFNINLGNPVTDSELITFTCDWFFEIR